MHKCMYIILCVWLIVHINKTKEPTTPNLTCTTLGIFTDETFLNIFNFDLFFNFFFICMQVIVLMFD